jgi:hypothetical protein
MNATGLQSYEYNPLGDVVAGRAGTVESTGYAPYGRGETQVKPKTQRLSHVLVTAAKSKSAIESISVPVI